MNKRQGSVGQARERRALSLWAGGGASFCPLQMRQSLPCPLSAWGGRVPTCAGQQLGEAWAPGPGPRSHRSLAVIITSSLMALLVNCKQKSGEQGLEFCGTSGEVSPMGRTLPPSHSCSLCRGGQVRVERSVCLQRGGSLMSPAILWGWRPRPLQGLQTPGHLGGTGPHRGIG